MPSFQKSLLYNSLVALALIMVAAYEWTTGHSLTSWGIQPRTWQGLSGLLFAPFLHGGFSHLLSNSVTLLLLGTSIYYFYPRATVQALPYLYFATSLGVWFFGRGTENGGIPVYHIGASGLLYAFAAFLFFSGLFRRDRQSLAVSMSVAIVYNGLIYSLFPNEPGVSWESHLSGFVVGLLCAYVFRGKDRREFARIAEEESAEGEKGYQPLENEHFRYHFRPSEKAPKDDDE